MKKTNFKILNLIKTKVKDKVTIYQFDYSLFSSLIKKQIEKTQISLTKISEDFQDNLPKKIHPLYLIQYLQDKVEQSFRSDSNLTFLKQSRFWATSITWALMGGTVFGIGWISIAKTDEIVIATGKLEPKSGVVDVQMPLEGIAREILVKEGEKVKKGQILINLDTQITKAKNESLKEDLRINQKIIDKLFFLVKEGAVSEIQYLEQKSRVENIKSQLKSNEVTLKYQKIISPLDGVVFNLKPKGQGYVARTSEPVLQIVPTENLHARVEISSRTIGFVKEGKTADISIDSFPASDFGVVEGVVNSIGSDALPPSSREGYRFPATIRLNQQYLKLNTGDKLTLQAGMSLTAYIKLRKVTYLQLLLNRFGDKAGSLKSI